MDNDDKAIEKIVLTELMRLNALILGLISGLILGLGIFVATNFLLLKGGPDIGAHLGLLSQFFFGYDVTFIGSLIGLGYGFVTGFVVGFAFAALYNWLAEWRDRRTR
jgi:hypothetical protein